VISTDLDVFKGWGIMGGNSPCKQPAEPAPAQTAPKIGVPPSQDPELAPPISIMHHHSSARSKASHSRNCRLACKGARWIGSITPPSVHEESAQSTSLLQCNDENGETIHCALVGLQTPARLFQYSVMRSLGLWEVDTGPPITEVLSLPRWSTSRCFGQEDQMRKLHQG